MNRFPFDAYWILLFAHCCLSYEHVYHAFKQYIAASRNVAMQETLEAKNFPKTTKACRITRWIFEWSSDMSIICHGSAKVIYCWYTLFQGYINGHRNKTHIYLHRFNCGGQSSNTNKSGELCDRDLPQNNSDRAFRHVFPSLTIDHWPKQNLFHRRKRWKHHAFTPHGFRESDQCVIDVLLF